MKKLYVLLLVAISFSAQAQLSGTYTVYGTSPDYATIQAACTDLENQGQSGAVTFDIRDGIHVESVILNAVTGNSATNTITFRSENGDSALVDVVATTGHTFTFNTVSYVKFEDITLINPGTANSVVQVNDGTDYSFSLVAVNMPLSSEISVRIENNNDVVENISFTNSTIWSAGGGVYIYTDSDDIMGVTIDNSIITANGGISFELESSDGISDLNVTNSQITNAVSDNSGLYMSASGDIADVTIDGSTISTEADDEYATYIYSDGGDISDLTIENSKLYSTNLSTALYVYANNMLSNVTFTNDSMLCNTSDNCCDYPDVAQIEGYNGGVDSLSVNGSYFQGSVDYSDDALGIYSDDGNITNVTIEGSEFIGNYGLYGYAEYNTSNWNVDSNAFMTYYDAAYISGNYDYVDNVIIKNNTMQSDNDDGIDIYSEEYVSNITVTDNTINSDDDAVVIDGYNAGVNTVISRNNVINSDYYGLYVGSYYGLIENVHITADSITSYYESIYIQASDYGINYVTIDSVNIISEDDGIYMEADYEGIYNISVTNSKIVADTIYTSYDGIYIESDDADADSITITNNEIYSSDIAIYVEGDYGPAANTTITHNKIWARNGIEIDGVGSNTNINWNTIQGYGNTVLEDAINVYGDYQPYIGVSINNNEITNAEEYGIYAQYVEDLVVENNLITNDSLHTYNTSHYAISAQYVSGSNTKISGNKVMTSNNGYDGISIYYSDFPVNSPALISNNFVAGFAYSVDVEYSTNVDVVHNSMSTSNNTQMAYLYDLENVNVWNNIFKDYGTSSGGLYYGFILNNVVLDNNAYDFDTTNTSMSLTGDYGNSLTLAAFQTNTSQDANSLETDAMYVNDSTDLHINCANTTLTAGLFVPSVTRDIDGILRNTTTTTIGAHEIDPASDQNALADSMYICNSVEVTANGNFDTYTWSTSAITSTITVTNEGVYYLTVTDGCGNQFIDSVVVYNDDVVVANFLVGANGNDVIFNNNSTGGTTYDWDFGDGNTSTDQTPLHTYADLDSTYTITLIVTNECGVSDTTTKEISIVDVPENLEARGLNIYPNPSKGNLTVDFGLLLGENINLNVIDLQGRVVYSKQITNQIGAHQEQLDIRNNANGIYFLRIDTEHESVTKRIIKN